MTRLELALEQIRQARAYTCYLLNAVEPGDWFRMPPGSVSHIGWQVGHLATTEYILLMERIRGPRPGDRQLIAQEFRDRFGRCSVPQPGTERNPPVDEVLAVLNHVHEQALAEVARLSDCDLDAAPLRPHPQFNTKFGALTWAARHEMLHAGQIGLLRHQLGAQPLR